QAEDGIRDDLVTGVQTCALPIYWTLEHFKQVVARATNGQAVVLQFHGSPDIGHPWVHTPPERLREYLTYLRENAFRCIAVRDLRSEERRVGKRCENQVSEQVDRE